MSVTDTSKDIIFALTLVGVSIDTATRDTPSSSLNANDTFKRAAELASEVWASVYSH